MSIGRHPSGCRCRICDAPSDSVGAVYGRYSKRSYHMRRCPNCHFAFIADPLVDFARIYDERYYEGRGADRMVDYRFELDWPDRTIHTYEWAGISQIVDEFVGHRDGLRWLD